MPVKVDLGAHIQVIPGYSLEMYDEISGNWITEADLPAINANLVESDISTINKMATATGGRTRLIPQVKSNPEAIELLFMYQTDLKIRIEYYIDNAYKLRITMHTGRKFIGYFVRQNATWRAWKGDEQKYLLSATFDVVSAEG